jgi:DNA-binding NtrC family response regulator
MKYGATDFVVKPWENEKLIATVNSALNYRKSVQEVGRLKSKQIELSQLLSANENIVIGESELIKQLFKTVEKVANTDANILILGENGTGKEVIAKAIHQISSRSNAPFVKVDLGAISSTLFESELFGHKKGAFTDAHQDKAGRFEIAHSGTLFLDEIGNISPELQAKLLSVIQNRIIIPVGSSKEIPIDIRLICASNLDLNEMAKNQEFREDLLYRLKTVEIILPPLRKRKEDIPLFIQHFLRYYSYKYRKPQMKVDKQTMDFLKNYDWPGNIRELQHKVERAVILSDNENLKKGDFNLKPETFKTRPETLNLDEVEKEAIKEAISKSNGNLTKAAKELGLGRTTLYRKIQKYGL